MPHLAQLVLISFVAAWCCAGALDSRAEDIVHVAVGDNVRSRTKLTGEVLDYTGETLLMRLPGGNERAFPADRVFHIETQRTPEHMRGEELLGQRQFAAALPAFRTALDKEQRRWVRREIIARLTVCHREHGDWIDAGKYFLLLLESDPSTRYFDAMPLAWNMAEPAAGLRAAAEQWLARDEAAAQLLGASHLLSTDLQAAALTRLKSLSYDRDPRVAWLARAQVWRVGLATAGDAQIRSWSDDIEQAPETLRAGGYLMAGRAWSQRQQPARAALSLMHVPILHPDQHALAAAALYEAGLELETIGQKEQASSLYREVADRFSGSIQAAEASRRLEQTQRPESRAAESPAIAPPRSTPPRSSP